MKLLRPLSPFVFGAIVMYALIYFDFIPMFKNKNEEFNNQNKASTMTPKILNIENLLKNPLDYSEHGFYYFVLGGNNNADILLMQMEKEIQEKHMHPNEDHFLYIISGKAESFRDDKKIILTPGNFVIIPKGTVHGAKRIGDLPFIFIQFSVPPFDEKKTIWTK